MLCHLPSEEEPDTLRHPQGDLWVPNAFTPQHEVNALFRARGYDMAHFEMFIFDRAGRQLFHTTDLCEGWDGTFRGCPQPQATYTWMIRTASSPAPTTSKPASAPSPCCVAPKTIKELKHQCL